MPTATTNKPAKLYELTVGNFFADMGEEKGIMEMPVVKTLTVNPNENTSPIYASGLVYDVQSVVGEPQSELDAVALPREFDDWALGAKSFGPAAADMNHPEKPTFPVGYVCELSDHSYCYYYHPLNKLTRGTSEHRTSTNQPVDPSTKRTLHHLSTDEGLWRVRYYTRGVEKPLSPAEFFAGKYDTLEKIAALDTAAAAAAAAQPANQG